MKKPNDKKRPSTKGSIEDRERKRNYKYIWVSKRILDIKDPRTGLVHQVLGEGRTYTPNKRGFSG